MKRILVLPFKDGDVSDGLRRLIALNPDALILFPVMDEGYKTYNLSIMKTITDADVKYHIFFTDSTNNVDPLILKAEDITMCTHPVREILREVNSEDILAMVWDESIEAHLALHAVEDLAIETWNVDEGLDMIEVDYDEDDSDVLYEEMQEKFSEFIESFSTYIISGVIDVLGKTIKDRLAEEEGKKDVSPFDNEE